MTDLSSLSDEELKALYAQSPVSAMSDDELKAAYASSHPQTHQPGYLEGAERGLGLTTRAAIQGITGVPSMVADFGHAVYDLATSPEARSATWEAAKHPSKWLQMPSDAPSQQFSHALDPYLPQPSSTGEKLASIALGAETGAMMPQVPVPGAQAPANFLTPAQQQAQRLAASLKASKTQGLVVPPSTTNPTWLNKTLETIGGKEATQNQARVINQSARNELAAQDLGLRAGMMTPEAVAAVKHEAGNVFQQARQIPRFQTGQEYQNDLDQVLSSNRGANADFPGASNPDVQKVVDTYRQASFTGDAAVSAVKLLRQKADDAFRQGHSELGHAYKGVSRAIEAETERGALRLEKPPEPQQFSLDMGFADQGDIASREVLNRFGPAVHGPEGVNGPMVYDASRGSWTIAPQTQIRPIQEIREFGPSQQQGLPFSTRAAESFGPKLEQIPAGKYSSLVDALRRARTTYAKASTIEDAMDAQGNVSGTKLAQAWKRGEPLSGGTLMAAEHAVNFPKANLPANSSNISHLNMYGAPMISFLTEHATGSPWGLAAGAALPVVRSGARSYLLSGRGQLGALPGQTSKAAALAKALSQPSVMAGAYNASSNP